MQKVNEIFLKAQEPLEEKELLAFISSDIGNKVSELEVMMAIKNLKSKMIEDIEIFYPRKILGNALDSSDVLLKDQLQQQLLVVSKTLKTSEYKERKESLEKLRDQKVILLWNKRNSKQQKPNATTLPVTKEIKRDKKVEELTQEKIKALHELNNVKDAAHNLFGALAIHNQCTVKDVLNKLTRS